MAIVKVMDPRLRKRPLGPDRQTWPPALLQLLEAGE